MRPGVKTHTTIRRRGRLLKNATNDDCEVNVF